MGIFEYLVWRLGRLGSMPRDRLKAVVILGTTLVAAAIMIGGGVSTLQPDPDWTFQDRQARMYFQDDGRASLRMDGTTPSDHEQRCMGIGGEPDTKRGLNAKFIYVCYVEPDTIVQSEDECDRRGGQYSVVFANGGPVQICQG